MSDEAEIEAADLALALAKIREISDRRWDALKRDPRHEAYAAALQTDEQRATFWAWVAAEDAAKAETPTTDAPSLGIDAESASGHRSAGGPSVEEDASRGSARVSGGCP